MKHIPGNPPTNTEIDAVIANPDIREGDPRLPEILLQAGPLYSRLWTLSCVAVILARKRAEEYLSVAEMSGFREIDLRYLGQTLCACGFEIDTIENLTVEEVHKVVRLFFDRTLAAVDEKFKLA